MDVTGYLPSARSTSRPSLHRARHGGGRVAGLACPTFHEYTEIQNYYKYPDAIPVGTLVRVTEKIHGTNSRVGVHL